MLCYQTMKKFILSLFVVFFIGCQADSQERPYTNADIQQDLRFAYEQLTKQHPGLRRYTSKQELDRYVNDLTNNAPDSMDVWQAYSYMSQLMGEIRCGHTRLFPNDDALEQLRARPVFSRYRPVG